MDHEKEIESLKMKQEEEITSILKKLEEEKSALVQRNREETAREKNKYEEEKRKITAQFSRLLNIYTTGLPQGLASIKAVRVRDNPDNPMPKIKEKSDNFQRLAAACCCHAQDASSRPGHS